MEVEMSNMNMLPPNKMDQYNYIKQIDHNSENMNTQAEYNMSPGPQFLQSPPQQPPMQNI